MAGPTAPPRTVRSRVQRAGVAAALLLAGYLAVATVCFVLPRSDPEPAHADVALVLGPPTLERQAAAMSLLRRGVVDDVQMAIGIDFRNPYSVSARAVETCRLMREVRCALPVPFSTQGEARMLQRGSRVHGWRSAIVLTQNAHLLRARTIVGRCFDGPIAMRASGEGSEHGWPYQFAYQTAASLKAWLVTPTC